MKNEIKCPNCGTVFTVDESEYASLLEQVRTKEFEKSVAHEVAQANMQAQKDTQIALLKAKQEADIQLARKEGEIAALKDKLANKNEELKMQVKNAIADKDKEIFELKTEMQSNKEKFKSEKDLLVAQHKKELDAKDETIGFYKDFKTRMSTKMVGESLEQHCENEFNAVRAMSFPRAEFGKDNDAKTGSKGDYIYREYAKDGTEIISIMFEMKNEMDTTATKHKNEHFFAELDKDRREKKCEYAILVSMLEPDSELYNKGIVDVSYRYEKMFVVRPQFFVPMISLLRSAAANALKYRQEAEMARRQNSDITKFEDKLLDFKDKFSKNMDDATDRFNDAIKAIDESIEKLQKVKENLLKSEKHLNSADNRLRELTIRKLTYGNPTMKAMFDEMHDLKEKEQKAIEGEVVTDNEPAPPKRKTLDDLLKKANELKKKEEE